MAHFLHKMAAYGDLVEVTAMLEDGLDPDERDEAGRTALMYAADGGHVEVMQALLDAGADVNASDEAGQTALMYGIPLGLPPVPKLLIEAGADVNAADEFGKTALHEAVSQNYVITVDLLVEAGADPTREDDLGKSPLAEAEATLERYRTIVRQLKAARKRGQARRKTSDPEPAPDRTTSAIRPRPTLVPSRPKKSTDQ